MAQEIESTADSQEEVVLLGTAKKDEDEEEGLDPNAWMLTFSDLITLMMTFFVLLFSFNDPNPKEVEAISNNAPGLFSHSESAVSQPVAILNANSLVKENIEIFLSENNVTNVEVTEDQEGLIITLPADIIFAKNNRRLSAKAKATIQKITSYLKKTTHDIRVEGHTDNAFQPGRKYQDAWDLSLDRGNEVLKTMLGAGIDPKRLSLVGKGAASPRFSNNTKGGRQGNRRVEIRILNPGQ